LTSPIFDGGNLIEDLSVAADAGTFAASPPEFRKLAFWRSTGERRVGRSRGGSAAGGGRESGNECGARKVRPRGAAGEREIPAERPVHYA